MIVFGGETMDNLAFFFFLFCIFLSIALQPCFCPRCVKVVTMPPSHNSDLLCQRLSRDPCNRISGWDLISSFCKDFFFMEILRYCMCIWGSSLSGEWVRILPTCHWHLFIVSEAFSPPQCLCTQSASWGAFSLQSSRFRLPAWGEEWGPSSCFSSSEQTWQQSVRTHSCVAFLWVV